MKARILASLIITGILASSAAQADSTITVGDINASYLNPSFTRNADVSSYTTSIQVQQNVAASAAQAGVTIVEDINASYSNPSFTRNADMSNYMVSTQVEQGARKVALVSVPSIYNLDPSGVVSSN